MPPDFGSPVAQNVHTPDVTSTLSGLMGLQQKQQQLQLNNQQLQVGANDAQAAQQTQQERQRVTQMMQSGVDDQGNSIRDANGEPDPAKILPALGRMAPLTGQGVAQNIVKTLTAKVGLQSAATSLDSQQKAAIMGPIQSLAVNPSDEQIGAVNSTLDAWGQQHPEMASNVAQAKYLVSHIQSVQDPEKRSEMANKLGALFQGGQQVDTQPKGATVNNGRRTLVGTTAPPVAGGAFTSQSSVQQQLPPSTQTVDSTGTQGVIGAPQADFTGLKGPGRATALADIASADPDENNRREAANVAAGRPQGFVPTGMAPGQAQNIADNVGEMNRHFASLNDQASGAQLVEGLTGNIKSLAPGAATGTEAGRKAYVVGLLNALHLGNQATGDLQKDTDLLEKNMAQLNLATPASSDAARSLISAARPHGTMNEGAITEAADQLASQVKANMSMRNALQGYKMMGDVQGYANARQKLEQVADPRAWQYEALGPGSPAAKTFVDRLTPSDKAALGSKIQQLEQMGMFSQ